MYALYQPHSLFVRSPAGYVSINGQLGAPEIVQPPRPQPVTVVVNAEPGEQFAWVTTPDGNFDNSVTDILTANQVCVIAEKEGPGRLGAHTYCFCSKT
jgi:hypothetical protein